MEQKTFFVKEMMERWNMNEPDFIAFVARHLPRIIYEDFFDYSSDCKICRYESTCPNRLEELNGGRFLCKGFLQPYQATRMRDQDPTGTAEIHEHPERVFFRRDHVEQFEKVCVCPELLSVVTYVPLEGEKPIWGYEVIGKHLGVTAQTVKKNYKPQGAPIENVGGKMKAYRSCLDKWASDNGKRGKKNSSK